MTLPSNPQFRIGLGAGEEEAFMASCMYVPPAGSGLAAITEHREEDNPFEAVWNAVVAVMTALGFDDTAAVEALIASFTAPGEQDRADG